VASSSLAGQDIPDILSKTELHYCVHKSPPGVAVLSKVNPVHPHPPTLFISGRDKSITVPELTITAHRENCAILGYYAASSINSLPTFRDLGCPETSVRNYYYLLRNRSEERSSHLLRGGSLNSRNRRAVPLTRDVGRRWFEWSASCPECFISGKRSQYPMTHF